MTVAVADGSTVAFLSFVAANDVKTNLLSFVFDDNVKTVPSGVDAINGDLPCKPAEAASELVLERIVFSTL